MHGVMCLHSIPGYSSTNCGLGYAVACWFQALQCGLQRLNWSCNFSVVCKILRKLDTCANNGHYAGTPFPLPSVLETRLGCVVDSTEVISSSQGISDSMYVHLLLQVSSLFPSFSTQLQLALQPLQDHFHCDRSQTSLECCIYKKRGVKSCTLKKLFLLKNGRYLSFSLNFRAGNWSAILKLALYNLNACILDRDAAPIIRTTNIDKWKIIRRRPR